MRRGSVLCRGIGCMVCLIDMYEVQWNLARLGLKRKEKKRKARTGRDRIGVYNL
jgi:hypothetical protein